MAEVLSVSDCLKQYLPGQSYSDLFRLALLHEMQSPKLRQPGHLAGDGALGEAQALTQSA